MEEWEAARERMVTKTQAESAERVLGLLNRQATVIEPLVHAVVKLTDSVARLDDVITRFELMLRPEAERQVLTRTVCRTNIDRAESWLLAFLVDGPKSATAVMSRGQIDGHSKQTLKMVKRKLRIRSLKSTVDWYWCMQGQVPPDRVDARIGVRNSHV